MKDLQVSEAGTNCAGWMYPESFALIERVIYTDTNKNQLQLAANKI